MRSVRNKETMRGEVRIAIPLSTPRLPSLAAQQGLPPMAMRSAQTAARVHLTAQQAVQRAAQLAAQQKASAEAKAGSATVGHVVLRMPDDNRSYHGSFSQVLCEARPPPPIMGPGRNFAVW